MSITRYSKYRRQGLRRAWHMADMNQTVAYAAAVALAMLVVGALIAWHDASVEDAERAGRQHGAAEREGYRKDGEVLAHALNGKPLLDRATGDVIFFQVSRQPGL